MNRTTVKNRNTGSETHFTSRSLEHFANIGEEPEDWREFQLKHPKFFSMDNHAGTAEAVSDASEWLYSDAERWTQYHPDLKDQSVPTLLWYRDLLRMVWVSEDPDGVCLSALYGMRGKANSPVPLKKYVTRHLSSPGGPLNPAALVNDETHGLKPGEPTVDGASGRITWAFTCEFQQSVYELMQNRWRTKICPQCGRYFVAMRTAQAFCSPRCVSQAKKKRDLDYWIREGDARRKAKTKENK